MLALELAAEREKAEFLKSRGLEPEPSRIPKQFHRGLKGYPAEGPAHVERTQDQRRTLVERYASTMALMNACTSIMSSPLRGLMNFSRSSLNASTRS